MSRISGPMRLDIDDMSVTFTAPGTAPIIIPRPLSVGSVEWVSFWSQEVSYRQQASTAATHIPFKETPRR